MNQNQEQHFKDQASIQPPYIHKFFEAAPDGSVTFLGSPLQDLTSQAFVLTHQRCEEGDFKSNSPITHQPEAEPDGLILVIGQDAEELPIVRIKSHKEQISENLRFYQNDYRRKSSHSSPLKESDAIARDMDTSILQSEELFQDQVIFKYLPQNDLQSTDFYTTQSTYTKIQIHQFKLEELKEPNEYSESLLKSLPSQHQLCPSMHSNAIGRTVVKTNCTDIQTSKCIQSMINRNGSILFAPGRSFGTQPLNEDNGVPSDKGSALHNEVGKNNAIQRLEDESTANGTTLKSKDYTAPADGETHQSVTVLTEEEKRILVSTGFMSVLMMSSTLSAQLSSTPHVIKAYAQQLVKVVQYDENFHLYRSNEHRLQPDPRQQQGQQLRPTMWETIKLRLKEIGKIKIGSWTTVPSSRYPWLNHPTTVLEFAKFGGAIAMIAFVGFIIYCGKKYIDNKQMLAINQDNLKNQRTLAEESIKRQRTLNDENREKELANQRILADENTKSQRTLNDENREKNLANQRLLADESMQNQRTLAQESMQNMRILAKEKRKYQQTQAQEHTHSTSALAKESLEAHKILSHEHQETDGDSQRILAKIKSDDQQRQEEQSAIMEDCRASKEQLSENEEMPQQAQKDSDPVEGINPTRPSTESKAKIISSRD
ncbi:hypothetical protein FGO68_gene11656 [Halteria grandinella]|uniref:Uncharacterized protein n=1 Tax=Halteria grandinella TaxID=5974 RepID=A0A8J8NVQ3_HALGN|nr:hypothetical protein FGO68_gene11656 [Halteria grandinella]